MRRNSENAYTVSAEPAAVFSSATALKPEQREQLLLIHPQALNYVNIANLARLVGRSTSERRLYGLRNKLQSLWRVSMPAAMAWRAEYEVLHPEFRSIARARAIPDEVAVLLSMLYELADLPPSSLEATHLQSELSSIAKRLSAKLSSRQIVQVKPWSASFKEQLRQEVRLLYVQAHRHLVPADKLAQLPLRLDIPEKIINGRRFAALEQQKQERARVEKEAAAARARDTIRAWAEKRQVGPEHFPLSFFETLQSSDARTLFRTAYGKDPSPTELRRVFRLRKPAYQALVEFKRHRIRTAREQEAAQRKFESELLHGAAVQACLKITAAEYSAWVAAGRLPIAKTETFYKWGRSNSIKLHHLSQLAHATPEQIAAWRREDLEHLSPAARAARLRSLDRLAAKNLLIEVLAKLYPESRVKADSGGVLAWNRHELLNIEVPSADGSAGAAAPELWPVNFELQIRLPVPRTKPAVKALVSEVKEQFSNKTLVHHQQRLQDGIADFLASYESELSAEQRELLRSSLKERLGRGIAQSHAEPNGNIVGLLGQSVAEILRRIDKQRAQALLRLADYPQAFSLARRLSRDVRLVLGPTNSGKTHEALQALTRARSGVYLAPLRLLAMEVRDRLVAEGIPCNLVTGEERELMPGAQHTASTIEMLDTSRGVEVAVIDEIQMLKDPQRGWAWSRALLGVPARTVYVCGAPNARDLCVHTLEALGESHSVTVLERKTPLIVESKPLCPSGSSRIFCPTPKEGVLRSGDAVIAFSRKDVLTLSARFRNAGFTVATIYGALAPEVRRTEANRFANQEADILVATDAIGAGLNLPIRRVIFSTTRKFDGAGMRGLTASEIQQIAGRAGRFGCYPEGFVTAIDEHDLTYVREHLTQSIPSLSGRLSIAPDLWHIEALSQLLKTKSIGALLSFFSTQLHVENALFETASIADCIALGHEVDRLAPEMRLADKLTFSCAPVCPDKEEELAYFRTCVQAFINGHGLSSPTVESRVKKFVPRGNAYLQAAEELSKELSLYAWFSFKYPAVFHDTQALKESRLATSRCIESALLTQSGFTWTSKERFVSKRRSYWAN